MAGGITGGAFEEALRRHRPQLRQEPREDRAAYITSWLEVLKNNNRAIFTAAAHS